MTTTVKCPHCEQPVEMSPKNKWRPFCSERCRLIDLGAWIAEEHRIPSEEIISPTDIDDISDLKH